MVRLHDEQKETDMQSVSILWIIIFVCYVALVIAGFGLHAYLWRKKERTMRRIPLTFIPTYSTERPRYFTQRGMSVTWSSILVAFLLITLTIGCFVQAVVSACLVFPTGDDMDTRKNFGDTQFFEFRNDFLRSAGRLSLLVLAGIVMMFWFALSKVDDLRIFWMTPCGLHKANYVMVCEVTDEKYNKVSFMSKNDETGRSSSRFSTDAAFKAEKKKPVDQSLRKHLVKVTDTVDSCYIHFCGIRYPWNETSISFEPCPPAVPDVLTPEIVGNGRSEEQAQKVREAFGHNEVQMHKEFNLLKTVLITFINPFFVFPFIAIMTQLMDPSLSRREVPDLIKTGVMLLFVIAFWAFIEWHSSREVSSIIKANQNQPVAVLRGPQRWDQAAPKDIVPGDIIYLKQGDTVPADCIIIKGYTTVDESVLTGEPVGQKSD